MTTSTLARPTYEEPAVARSAAGGRVSTWGVLRSEWVKLRSVRSSVLVLAAVALTMLVFGVLVSGVVGGVFSTATTEDFGTDPTAVALAGTLLAQLVVGVLGVLVITGEYATGLIRTSLTAVPARLPVLAAKAGVVAAATFPVALASSLAAFLAGQALIGSGDLAPASLGDPGVLRAVVGTAGFLTGIALLGLALGALLRSTAAALSTLFAAVFLLPGLGSVVLPASWRDDLLQYLPSNAGTAFTTVAPPAELLSVGTGLAVFVAWVVVPLALAAVALRRRAA